MERTTQIDLWTYREADAIGIDMSRGPNLAGFSVEAADGGIGKIDEATYDASQSYLVVDTGPWIFGKKVLLPAGVIDRVDLDTETVFGNRSKDEIKNAPEFDRDELRDDEVYRDSVGSYYDIHMGGRKYADGAAKIVWIDLATGRPVPLPDAIAAPLRDFVG